MIHNHWLSITSYDLQPLAGSEYTTLFTITGTEKHTMIPNHWLSIAHHDTQPLAQHNTPGFTATGSA
jgi:hypothetical protein